MLYPLLLMITAFYGLFTAAVLMNMRSDLIWHHREAAWVRQWTGFK